MEAFRFLSRRFCVEPQVGMVGRRRGGMLAADSSLSARICMAILRFWLWERWEDATTLSSVPKRAMIRSMTLSEPDSCVRSQISSALVSDVLTCWPPGPELREKRHDIAEDGTVILALDGDN